MFIDKEWKKETSKIPQTQEEEKKKNYILYAVVGVFALLAFSLIIYLMKNPTEESLIQLRHDQNGNGEDGTASGAIGLPIDIGNGDEAQYSIGTSTQSIKAEDLTFGHFYEKQKDDFRPTLKSYDLPINVKIDVSNYYDISRKIDLDPYVDSLNNNGFAIIDAPVSLRNGDFFSAYRYLIDAEVPVTMTEDFLFYYYQNTLKQVFKEIEKNSFYENVWEINKKLYDISLARYKKSISELGMVNDPVLEGERTELAFFAVSLKLLEPTKEQINLKINFSDNTRFTSQESEIFSFDMPDYLKDDVNAEVDLIRKSAQNVKSPVLLYQRDYANFVVPGNYKNNAKLNNFYLTLKWMNTVFPLYYRNGDCSDCLLDKDDWIINMVASANIAKDFYENQDLKNQWAIIYKFISFFSGLRSDLTYLNYYSAYRDVFGDNYNVRDIFSRENENRNNDIAKIQERMMKFEFSDLEGGISRTDKNERPILGMRILQESYWPNMYLLDQLVGKEMLNKTTEGLKSNVTYCKERYAEEYYRCSGFGYDILNLMQPVKDTGKYFYNNTNYLGYDNRINNLRKKIDEFDVYTWNNNIYWVTLDIARNLISDNREDRPVYTRSTDWLIKRDYNTFLATWTNLHLPDDYFVSYYESSDGNLGVFRQCNKYNYIEPNISFVEDLISRNNMLVKMLMILESNKKTSTASSALKELNKKLAQVLEISKKELNNGTLSDDDCKFVSDMIKQVLETKGGRVFPLKFDNGLSGQTLKESIEGVKFLALIYQYGDQKILTLGPIFNFREIQ